MNCNAEKHRQSDLLGRAKFYLYCSYYTLNITIKGGGTHCNYGTYSTYFKLKCLLANYEILRLTFIFTF